MFILFFHIVLRYYSISKAHARNNRKNRWEQDPIAIEYVIDISKTIFFVIPQPILKHLIEMEPY